MGDGPKKVSKETVRRAKATVIAGLEEAIAATYSEAHRWGGEAKGAKRPEDATLFRERGEFVLAEGLVYELLVEILSERLAPGSPMEAVLAARLPGSEAPAPKEKAA